MPFINAHKKKKAHNTHTHTCRSDPLNPFKIPFYFYFGDQQHQMGKKMRMLPSIFKAKEQIPTTRPFSTTTWQWPSCNQQPKTHSFRAVDDMFKTVNSVYFDTGDVVTTPESWFTNSSESASFSTVSNESGSAGHEAVEMVIKGVRSERLFFEPGHDTNSILEKTKVSSSGGEGWPFKESVVLAMESVDPYVDFRRSMEEMVEAHGLKDWEYLEELLCWYLKVNGKKNHGFIIGAFVDLLVALFSDSSSLTSPSFCSLEGIEEEEDKIIPCLEI